MLAASLSTAATALQPNCYDRRSRGIRRSSVDMQALDGLLRRPPALEQPPSEVYKRAGPPQSLVTLLILRDDAVPVPDVAGFGAGSLVPRPDALSVGAVGVGLQRGARVVGDAH
jgi:hypothetical protein